MSKSRKSKKVVVNTEAVAPAMFQDNRTFGEDREAIYQQYDQGAYGITAEPKEATPEATPEVSAEQEIRQPEIEPIQEATTPEAIPEVSAEQEQSVEAQPSESERKEAEIKAKSIEEKIKTVPLSALHEARSENKRLKERLKELDVKLVSKDTNELAELTEYDTLVNEVKQQRQELERLKGLEIEKMNLSATERIENSISNTDDNLQKEGVFGFKEIGRHIVTQRLQQMAAEDMEHARANDNPEGWSQIWREEYPKFKQMFTSHDMKKVFEEKQARKANAQLVSSAGMKPGSGNPVPTTPEEQRGDYMEMRRRTSIV